MKRYQYTDELYHYGVVGMRWGHRKAKYISNESKKVKTLKTKHKMSTKKKIILGSALTTSILASSYGLYKLKKDYIITKRGKQGEKYVYNAFKRTMTLYDKKNIEYKRR